MNVAQRCTAEERKEEEEGGEEEERGKQRRASWLQGDMHRCGMSMGAARNRVTHKGDWCIKGRVTLAASSTAKAFGCVWR